MVSIIIPALDEQDHIEATVGSVLRVRGPKEVIVVDGGSTDATAHKAECAGARVLGAPRGRGQQLRAACEVARGDVLWFLHADTVAPVCGIEEIVRACRDTAVAGGNFNLVFEGRSRAARYQTRIAAWSRWTGICYGDSGIFVKRDVYDCIGGIRPVSLFEDVDLVRRIRRAGKFIHLSPAVVTSARRFEGRWLRVWSQWTLLQCLYWAGVPPEQLAAWYRPVRPPSSR